MGEGKYEPPKETKGDLGHAAGRSLLGGIPFGGQLAIEIFNKVVAAPIERRRDEWRCRVGEAIEELERFRAGIVEELADNESFNDTLLQASHIAIRTSREEKLEALRNAVMNAALPTAPEDSLQAMFLHLVDRFSPMHLELLNVLDDPEKWIQEQGIQSAPKQAKKMVDVVYCIHREKEREWNEALCEQACRDLHDNGLVILSSLRKGVDRFPYFPKKFREEQAGYWFADELPSDSMVSYSGEPTAYRHWTTDLGRRFLAFIRSPARMGSNSEGETP